MRRLRAGFGLLALLLVAPLGFLIVRTLDTLERERELQHAAVANRVFDEAEGALADFLREEQARPADAYRHRPSGVEWMDARPSFVQAYFEVDGRGDVRTSATSPAVDAALRTALEPARVSELEEDVALRSAPAATPARRLERSTGRAGSDGRGAAGAAAPETRPVDLDEARADARPEQAAPTKSKADAPAPGTARNVQSIDLITGRAKAGKADALEEKAEAAPAYSSSGALEALGRIAKSTARAQAKPARDATEPSADAARERTAQRALDAPALEGGDRTSKRPYGLADAAAAAEAEPTVPAAPRAAAPDAQRRARLVLAPSRLSGERVDGERVLLHRTAFDEAGGAVRQGMLVSIDALGAWLTRRVLGESELRDSLSLELRASPAPPTRPLPADRYVYTYRFAEPFEMLSAQLALAPLDDGGNTRNIGWLSALLVAASTLGLFAVYRMASVAVHFAERRSNFAAAVSHELKTPLTAIRMYGEMLRDEMVPDEARRKQYFATITSESERLTRLIDNVLEWSRLEKHQREAALVSGDPSGPVREVVQVIAPHAEAEGFVLDVRLAPDLPPVRYDRDALQQILYNLIDNAIKYARGREPRRIEVEAVAVDGGVAIRVRDHGPGVPAKRLALVFEAFYRAESELTRETKGTGIGLALARGLADAMHARLEARNHPEGGFEVELRLGVG